MNKEDRMKLFEDYRKSLDKEKFNRALKQNRLLYNEIFTSLADSNGNKEALEAGLDQLEIEATEILPYVKLNPRRKNNNGTNIRSPIVAQIRKRS